MNRSERKRIEALQLEVLASRALLGSPMAHLLEEMREALVEGTHQVAEEMRRREPGSSQAGISDRLAKRMSATIDGAVEALAGWEARRKPS